MVDKAGPVDPKALELACEYVHVESMLEAARAIMAYAEERVRERVEDMRRALSAAADNIIELELRKDEAIAAEREATLDIVRRHRKGWDGGYEEGLQMLLDELEIRARGEEASDGE